MLYMNDYDIFLAQRKWASHPILRKATAFLAAFKEQVDSHSDGWAYWQPPVKAAANLMRLIMNPPTLIEESDLKRCLKPIKAFYTRRGNAAGMQMPKII